MLNRRFTGRGAARMFAAVSAAFLFSTVSEAQTITYVSAVGNDANPCHVITAPCETLQRGINAVLANGEVRLLTPLTNSAFVGKSVTISGQGNSLVGAIVIGNANAVVTLRGVQLSGLGGFANGVRINAAASVHIEDCTIERYTGAGIIFDTVNTEVSISGTVSRDNLDGIFGKGNPSAKLTIDHSRFENNSDDGIDLDFVRASIADTIVSGNGNDGIDQFGDVVSALRTTASNNGGRGFSVINPAGGGFSRIVVEFSAANGNAVGVYSENTGAIAEIANSAIKINGADYSNSLGGVTGSYGNNLIFQSGVNQKTPLNPQ